MLSWLMVTIAEAAVGFVVGQAITRAAKVAVGGLAITYTVAVANPPEKHEPTPAEIQLKQLQP